MTGFGSASRAWGDAPGGPATLSVEVRSVNARYLEVKVRQPFGVAAEHALRKQVEGGLGRGRVDVRVHLQTGDGTGALGALGLDAARMEVALDAAAEVQEKARKRGLEVSAFTAVELLRFSAGHTTPDVTADAPAFLGELLSKALADLVSMREREGKALEEALAGLQGELNEQMGRLREAVDGQAEHIHEKLRQRVTELCERVEAATPSEERLATELAVLVARADVSEELARIDSHLAQVSTVLGEPAQVGQGKTLDFLSQELLREITTVGGKIQSGNAIVIEAKGTVGRIREQVQNVE